MPVRFDKSDELDQLFDSFLRLDSDLEPAELPLSEEERRQREAQKVTDKPDFSKK